MYNLISVPLDTTTDSRRALPVAVDFARRVGAEIELVHVVTAVEIGPEFSGKTTSPATASYNRQRAVDGQFDDVVTAITRAGVSTRPVVTILDGGISKSLSEHLQRSQSDLVVMSTRDLTRIDRLLLGSISESVMRHAGAPALFVHEGSAELDLGHAPAIRHVLVPLDGSPLSERILVHAAAFAHAYAADLTLVAVLEPVFAAISAASATIRSGGIVPAPSADEIEVQTAETLNRVASGLRAEGLRVQTATLLDRRPGHAIVDYATHREMDLVAMTTHGFGALGRLVSGSVAEHVLHHWSGMALIFRPRP